MAINLRNINPLHGAGVGPDAHASGQARQGSWRGHSMLLAPPGIAKAHAEERVYGELQALATAQTRNLASRRVAAELPFRRMATADLFQRAQTMGIDLRRLRSSARDLFARGSAQAESGRRASAAQRYLSLHLAAAALEDDVTDDVATAMLTPVRGREHSPQDLSELLRHAANDSEEFEHFLEDILAGLDITPADAEEYADEIRRARNEDAKLMDLLRKLQQIPPLHREQDREERLSLRQRIHNEIREFESSGEGRQVLASFNAAPAAAQLADPSSFLQTYTDLVTVPRTFAAQLKLLLSRYPIDDIDGILDHLKKALGDDLEAATPSHDLARLYAVLSDLGHLAMSTTLVESVRELVALIRRRRLSRDGRGKKGRQPGAQGEDENEEGDAPDAPQEGRRAGR